MTVSRKDQTMLADRQGTCHLVEIHDYAALLEGSVVSFFSNVADIELLTTVPGQSQDSAQRSITAIINFSGNEKGFLALNCTDALARGLATNMLGESEELSEGFLCSALGEAATILMVSLLESIPGNTCHTTSTPAVIRGDEALLKKLLADPRGYSCSLFHGPERVLVKLVIHPPNCLAASDKGSDQAAITLHQAHRLFSCPRFGHPCRRDQHPDPCSPHTIHGAPYQVRPGSGFQGRRFDYSP